MADLVVAFAPEALIEEARERRRRRRVRVIAIGGLIAAAGLVAYGVIRASGGNTGAVDRVPHGPIVNVHAFRNHGYLAFVSHRKLWLLNGNARTLRALPTPGGGFTPWHPAFSSDGKWLVYLEQRHNAVTDQDYSRLWIANADGSDPHVVPGLEVDGFFGWSPTRDLVAVATGPERTRPPCPCYSPSTVRLVSPGGASRVLGRYESIYSASWSPDGRTLAVAESGVNRSRLVSYDIRGGRPTLWLARHGRERLNGMGSIVFTIAGWWRRFGIGLWVFGNGMVHNNDDTPLDAFGRAGATPRLLGRTLSDGTTDAVAASRRGQVALVTDHGGGRAAWQGKVVILCQAPTERCSALPHRAETVTVDPAWSPDGRTLAYVEAPDVNTPPYSQRLIMRWFAAHRLVVYDATTERVRPLAAGHGATAVTWSSDGKSLLYVRNDSLWLLPTLRSQPTRIATPLFPFYRWPQYYGQIAWADQFAWSSRGSSSSSSSSS